VFPTDTFCTNHPKAAADTRATTLLKPGKRAKMRSAFKHGLHLTHTLLIISQNHSPPGKKGDCLID
jgi:hypothetical protein